MKKSVRLTTVVALIGLLTGCSGGGGSQTSPPASVQSLDRSVRVVVRLSQPAPVGYLNDLEPELRQDAEAKGFVFRADLVDSPPIPATGYFLKVGDVYIPSGPNGEFIIPKDTAVPAETSVYKQLTDTQPLGSVSINNALQPTTEPIQTVTLKLQGRPLGSPSEMDGDNRSRSFGKTRAQLCCDKEAKTVSRAIQDGCKRVDCNVTTNDGPTGCCLDFRIPKGRIVGEDDGDGGQTALTGLCADKRWLEFQGSECWKWTFGLGQKSAACINEKAILQLFGPSCWMNHKYRYCQNMDPTAFGISSSGTVTKAVGEELILIVTNNTPTNETALSLSGNAGGTIEPSDGVHAMTGGMTCIEHYDDTAKVHKNDRTVTYRAPDSLPNGRTEANDTLTFTANGITKTVTVKVVQKCQDSSGRTVPCGK